MHHHSATVCSSIRRFSLKCSGKIIVNQLMQKLYQLVKYSLINSHNWIHVTSDVTLHENMTPLTVEDRQLIKKCKLKTKKVIVEFPAKQWKWHMLFDLLRIIKSTGFIKRLSGSDRRRSEWTDSNINSIKNLNCSQDRRPGHSFLGRKCFPLIL